MSFYFFTVSHAYAGETNPRLCAVQDIVHGRRQQSTWIKPSTDNAHETFSDTSSWSEDNQEDDIWTPESSPDGGPDDASAEHGELMTESKDLHFLINESITSLLRLSVQVHKSCRKAKFARSSTHKHYEIGPDISHVRDLFPHLDITGNLLLAERLGKANAQRRQWLWYRRRHREKLSVDLSASGDELNLLPGTWMEQHEAKGPGADTESIALFSVDEGAPASGWSPSLVSGTKASTFRSRPSAGSLLAPSVGAPETVFGRSSRAAASEQRLLAPQPPPGLVLGQPCFCRYCCNVVEISGKHAWQ